MRPVRRVVCTGLATGILLTLSAFLYADTILVPRVDLQEQEPGLYVLDATMARSLVSTAAAPVLPTACIPDAEPDITDQGQTFLVRYVLDCRERPLTAGDEIFLPWGVDGVQLTFRSADGEERRGLFGREPVGVVIRLDALLPGNDSALSVARSHFSFGMRHFFSGWVHPLLVLGLALMLPVGRLAASLMGFTAGHALAMVAVDLGARGVPPGPAEATVAAALLVFALSLTKDPRSDDGALSDRRALVVAACTTAFAGLIHGLGLATELASNGLGGANLVVAVFAASTGVDVVAWALGIVVSVVATVVVGEARERVVPVFATVGAFLVFATMAGAVRPEGRLERATGSYLEVAAAPAAGRSVAGVPSQLDAAGRLARPFIGYLIVEPFQVRLEVLVAVPAMEEWLDLPVSADGILSPADGQAVAQRTADVLAAQTGVLIDGSRRTPAVQTADFVTVGSTGVLARGTPVPEAAATAILGATLLYETEGLAEAVEVQWGLMPADGGAVPMTITDPAAALESELTAERATLEWRNTLGDFALPAVESVGTGSPRLPLASILLFGVALGLGAVARNRRRADGGSEPKGLGSTSGRLSARRSLAAPVGIGLLVAAYALYPFARVEADVPFVGARLGNDAAGDVLEKLLTNVYRSFDIHAEEAVYDRLALTVTGDQLVDIYLESRQALELENRGGARVRIEEVVVQQIRSVRPAPGGGYDVDLVWTVGGSVNHFGHQHFRQNRYDAVIRIVPVGDVWKIESVEVAEERRLL